MLVLFVAQSDALAEWASDVGLTKHIYRLGLAEGSREAAVEALNAESSAGFQDWKLMKTEEVEAADADVAIERLARKEKMVDPVLYPKIRGVRGIFKIKPANVENAMLVKRALAGDELKAVKPKPVDFAAYMIENASK